MTNTDDKRTLQLIHLLIVDDHQMVRDGIKVMLSAPNKYYQFRIDESETGEEAIKKIIYKDFDVVILDYHLPGMNGAIVTEDILRYKPGVKILALSNYDELVYVEKMINAGAKGYILKNIEPAQLLNAIRTILSDQIFYSNEIAVKLIDAAKMDPSKIIKEKHSLTKRETEILKLIAMELTNEKIAEKLSLSKRTIDTHRQNLLLKLDARNTAGLIRLAYKMNLIS